MLERVVALLAPRPGETYADATAGLGGHAAAIARVLGPSGSVILNDLDPANLACARDAVAQAAPSTRLHSVNANFAGMPYAAPFREPAGARADMLLADLGFASTQVDDASRGFSFGKDGPLDMRFAGSDASVGTLSAADLVNAASEAELARIIDEYGEERFARSIARRIVQARATSPIQTTTQLAQLVRAVVRSGGRGGPTGIDPATRTFQALRIAVNDEMGSLDAFLAAILDDAKRALAGTPTRWLAPGARVVIISFHSLEDRRVKAALAKGRKDATLVPIHATAGATTRMSDAMSAESGVSGEGVPTSTQTDQSGTDQSGTNQPPGVIRATLDLDQIAEPTEEEIRANPRARSAKVRAARLALPK